MRIHDRTTRKADGGRRRPPLAALAAAMTLTACGSAGPTSGPARPGAVSVTTAPFAPAVTGGLSTAPPPWPLPADAGPDILNAGLSVSSAETLTVHYHAHLDIQAGGQQVTVPGGVGFVIRNGAAVGITSVHTHDSSGVVHIESPADRSYTLGQFFTEWGVLLGPGRMGGLVDGGGNALRVFVDGNPFAGDPAEIVFRPHEEIALWFGPASQAPQVPSSYSFPSGE